MKSVIEKANLAFSRKHETRDLVFYWRFVRILFIFIDFGKGRMEIQKYTKQESDVSKRRISQSREKMKCAISRSFVFSNRQVVISSFHFDGFWKRQNGNIENRNSVIETANLAFSRKPETRDLAFFCFPLQTISYFLFSF